MSLMSGSASGNRAPDNVTSGDFTVTVNNGNYPCGNTVQPIVLDNALLTASPPITRGKYVLIRVLKSAGSIQQYAGAIVTPPTGLTVYSVSHEDVVYSDGTYDCICVTLV